MLTMLVGRELCACCAYAYAPADGVRSAAASAFWCDVPSVTPVAPLRQGAVTRAPFGRFTPPHRLLIEGATVIDPRDGTAREGASVRTEGGRIVDVGSGAPRSANSPERIDGAGKFIVPGYNDMHSHALELEDPSGSLALMLAEGVTGFRQMSGSPALLAHRRADRLALGEAAPALLQAPGTILTPFSAPTPAAVATEIRAQKEQGADFIKMVFTNPDVFFAATAEANRVGLPIVGHLQDGVDAAEASQAGFHSVEHLGTGSSVWLSCSTAGAELRADARAHAPRLAGLPFRLPRFVQRLILKRLRRFLINPAAFARATDVARLGRALETFDPARAEVLAARFKADGSWQVPTLVRLRTQQLADAPEYEADPALRYLPAANVKAWREVIARFRRLPEAMRAVYRAAYPRQLALTKLLADAGVSMMVGTDGGSMLGPGLSLRQEFAELAAAGLTPVQILRMATTNAAAFLNRAERMGRVAAGYDADLVVLDADPRADVGNLHRIAGVVRAGTYWPAAELEALKARVAASGRGVLA